MITKLAPPGRLFAPGKSPLAPPAPLSPPFMSWGESTAALPDDMARLTARVGLVARKASSRATAFAVQHAPTVKQAALNASASASMYVKQATQNAVIAAQSEQEKLSDPAHRQIRAKQGRKIGGAVVACILVLGGGGWFSAKRQATSEAKAQIDNFIYSNHLASEVTYRSISASPFGSATMYGVMLALNSGTNIAISAAKISDITRTDGQVTGGTLFLRGVNIPALKILRLANAQFNYNQEGDALRNLAGLVTLGYTEITGDVSLTVHPVADGGYKITSSGSLNDMGNWSGQVELGNLPNNIIQNLQQTVVGFNTGIDGSDGLLALTSVTLRQANFTLNNKSLMNRFESLSDKASPSDSQAQPSFPLNTILMVSDGMAHDQADQIQKTLNDWSIKGGILTIKSNLNQPLPLMASSSKSFFGQLITVPQPAILSIEDFLAKTNAQVSF